jgi:uncharacterized protein
MVTQTCNLACAYCYANAGTYNQPTRYQQLGNAISAIEQLIVDSGATQHLTVTFFGGEPLIGFSLIKDIVSYCKSRESVVGKRFKYSVTTNGTLVTGEIADYFKNHGFTVMVSVDGAAQYHDSLRPFADGGGSFDRVKEGVRTLVTAGLAVQLRSTLVKEMVNRNFLIEAIGTTRSWGGTCLHLSPVDCTHIGSDLWALGPHEIAEMERLFESVTRRNIERAGNESIVFDPHAKMIEALAHGKAVGHGRCGACRGSAAVATDGPIYPCHRFVGMDEYTIGHVDTGGIDRAKANWFLQAATEAFREKCSACFARLICGGVCFHSAADGRGGFCAPDEKRCGSIRGNLRRSIGFVLELRDTPVKARLYAEGIARQSRDKPVPIGDTPVDTTSVASDTAV